MTPTSVQNQRALKMFQEIAKNEPVSELEYNKGTYYMNCSELAALRIAKNYPHKLLNETLRLIEKDFYFILAFDLGVDFN